MRPYDIELLDSLPFPPSKYEERQGRLHLMVQEDQVRPLLSFLIKKEDGELSNLYHLPSGNCIMALVVVPRRGVIVIEGALEGTTYPSLTIELPSAHWYEREMMEMSGIVPLDHPNMRPLHLHDWPKNEHPLSPSFPSDREVPLVGGTYHYRKVEGEGIMEVPVGPVHAGVIEPGHFRFSTAGEPIINLEVRLGFVHRGVEKSMEGCPLPRALRLTERISGDNGVAHSMAFCQAVEMGTDVPERAKMLRCIYSEMERIYNHLGDIGGMATDVAFAVPAAAAATLRERMLRLNHDLTGHRLLWGTMVPGGVAKDIDAERSDHLQNALVDLGLSFDPIEDTLFNSPSFLDRVETTGTLSLSQAKDLRATGPVARASGWDRDARRDFPYAAYARMGFQVQVQREGDVLSRLRVKIGEMRESMSIVKQCLDLMQDGELRVEVPVPDGMGVGLVESPRGELVHCVHFENGKMIRYKVRDPSFCNWPTMEKAVLGNIVPDFPLINKSYNLSYAGNDL
ncbi:MAG: NADH-quinone oxidoreductase subunit C [Methanomassiliicoccales archaeon]|nr:NADH-quinone oxidoreductase subunit C [Methanomassiliicoccales archaeon]